jgi:hypothetical protein
LCETYASLDGVQKSRFRWRERHRRV